MKFSIILAAMCCMFLISCSASYAQVPGQQGVGGTFDREQQQRVQTTTPRTTLIVIFPRHIDPALLAMLFGGDVIYGDSYGSGGGNGRGNGDNGGWGNGNDSGRGSGYGSNSGGRRSGGQGGRGGRR